MSTLAATNLKHASSATNNIVLDTSGNVGIGTSAPSYKLEVRATAGGVGAVVAGADAGGNAQINVNSTFSSTSPVYGFFFNGTTGIGNPASNVISAISAGTETMRIDSSGNVGIGTSSPDTVRALTLNRAGNYGGIALLVNGSTQARIQQESTGSLFIDSGITNTAGSTIFRTANGTERARITSGGDFLVGATAAFTTNTSGVALRNLGTAGRIVLSSTNSGSDLVYFYTSTALAGSIVTSGGTATAYNTTSDYRLKDDVRPIKAGLTTIAALNPVTYKWKVSDSYGEGFIAHELQSVIPAAVTGEKDAVNADGSIKPQGVDYSKIVVHLVAAIQELKADFDAYKAAHP